MLLYYFIVYCIRYCVFGIAEYQVPPAASTTWQTYVNHIASLPLSAPPQVFGLHANADLAKDLCEADQVKHSLE